MTDPANPEAFEHLKRTLQAFQSERLNDTYRDLKNDPEYAKIQNQLRGHFEDFISKVPATGRNELVRQSQEKSSAATI